MKKFTKKNEEIIVMERKTFLERHARKILLAAGVVFGSGAYYILKKHNVELDKQKTIVVELKDKVKVLQEAASEGLYEEAIATTTRKINARKDKLEYLTERSITDKTVNKAIDKTKSELSILLKRRDAFQKAQDLYYISEE